MSKQILTGTDKTAVILSHQTGHEMTDHATGTSQTLRRQGPAWAGSQWAWVLSGGIYGCLPSKQPFHLSSKFGRSIPMALHDLHRLCQTSCSSDTMVITPVSAFHLSNALEKLIIRFQMSSSEVCFNVASQNHPLDPNTKRLTEFFIHLKNEHICIDGASRP